MCRMTKIKKTSKKGLTKAKASDIIFRLHKSGRNLENRTTGKNDETNGFGSRHRIQTNLEKISLIPKRAENSKAVIKASEELELRTNL